MLSFWIHSTFRDPNDARNIVKPSGLQWGVHGTSHLSFVVPTRDTNMDNASFRQGIVHAYNLWAFARGERFCHGNDIQSIRPVQHNEDDSITHYVVDWKAHNKMDWVYARPPIQIERFGPPLKQLLQQDAERIQGNVNGDRYDVYLNGKLVGSLESTGNTLPGILQQLANEQEYTNPMEYKRWDPIDDNDGNAKIAGLIRIERFFTGGLRKRPQIWNHIWDNLLALEDVSQLSENEWLGTATSPDWIMGGRLTSRLYIQYDAEARQALFLRPLYRDDLDTSDRRFVNKDPRHMALLETEILRWKALATLTHPVDLELSKQNGDVEHQDDMEEEKDPAWTDRIASIRKGLQANKGKRKFFGL